MAVDKDSTQVERHNSNVVDVLEIENIESSAEPNFDTFRDVKTGPNGGGSGITHPVHRP
jgi:hypothetical protein